MVMNAARMADKWFSPLPKTDRTTRLIEKITVEKSLEERIAIIKELGNSGNYGAVGSLIECCQDPDPEIRRSAIGGLHNLRSGRATSILIDRLHDKYELPEIRKSAAAALAAIRSYGALQELRSRYADGDEDRSLRSFIGGELDRIQILLNATPGSALSSPNAFHAYSCPGLRN